MLDKSSKWGTKNNLDSTQEWLTKSLLNANSQENQPITGCARTHLNYECQESKFNLNTAQDNNIVLKFMS